MENTKNECFSRRRHTHTLPCAAVKLVGTFFTAPCPQISMLTAHGPNSVHTSSSASAFTSAAQVGISNGLRPTLKFGGKGVWLLDLALLRGSQIINRVLNLWVRCRQWCLARVLHSSTKEMNPIQALGPCWRQTKQSPDKGCSIQQISKPIHTSSHSDPPAPSILTISCHHPTNTN